MVTCETCKYWRSFMDEGCSSHGQCTAPPESGATGALIEIRRAEVEGSEQACSAHNRRLDR